MAEEQTRAIRLEVLGLDSMDEAITKASKLDFEINRLKISNKNLSEEQKKLDTTTEEGRAAFEKASAAIIKNNAEISHLKQSYNQVTKEAKSVKSSMEELRAITSQLTQQANQFRVGIDGTAEDLAKLQSQIYKNKEAIRDFDRSMSGSTELVGEYSRGIINAFKQYGLADKAKAVVVELEKKQQALASQTQRLAIELKNSGNVGVEAQNKLQREFEESQKALVKLDNTVSQAKTELKGLGDGMGASFEKFRGGFLSGVAGGVGLGMGIAEIASQIANVGLESVKLAAQAEGVERAFNKLNNPALLDELRTATKGTVSDLELMKSAVKANNFQLPLEQLGTLFRFAQQRAQETGESVDYLTESIVLGISRKSIPILDNLGISSQQIQEEFKKTGDFAKAVGNIVQESLQKQGTAAETTADKMARYSAQWENLKKGIGDFLITLGGGVVDGLNLFDVALKNSIKNASFGYIDLFEKTKKATKSQTEYNTTLQTGVDLINAGVFGTKKKAKEVEVITQESLENQLNGLETMLKKADVSDKKYIAGLRDDIKKVKKQIAEVSGDTKADDTAKKKAEQYNKDILKLRADLSQKQAEANKDDFDRQIGIEIAKSEATINELQHRKARTTEEQKLISDLIVAEQIALVQRVDEINQKASEKQKQDFDKLLAENKKKIKDEQDANAKAIEQKFKDLALAQEKELTLLELSFKKGEISEEEYNKQKYEKQQEHLKQHISKIQDILNPPTADGSSSIFEALNLSEEEKLKLNNSLKELLNEQIKIQGDFFSQTENKRKEFTKHLKQLAYDTAGQLIIDQNAAESQAQDLADQKELEALKNKLDEKDKREADALKKSLDNKTITQEEFEIKTNKLREKSQEEYDKKEREIKTKQAERAKNDAIFRITLETAVAAIKAFGEGGPLAAAAAAASGLAAMALIAAKPIPQYAKGGIVNGPSHAEGGVKYYSPGGAVELEGGELVVNKNIWKYPEMVASISEMNAATGGVKFASGGVIPPIQMPRTGGGNAIDPAQMAAMIGEVVGQRLEATLQQQKIVLAVPTVTEIQHSTAVNRVNAST